MGSISSFIQQHLEPFALLLGAGKTFYVHV